MCDKLQEAADIISEVEKQLLINSDLRGFGYRARDLEFLNFRMQSFGQKMI
jgi:hypothetical protein